MNRVFSGGCVYEFEQGANGYGLVEVLKHTTDTRSAAYQQALDDQDKVVERRETDRGFVLIYADFANYKASLAAVRSAESDWDRDAMGPGVDTAHVSPGLEFDEPRSCVDWVQVEQLVRSGV